MISAQPADGSEARRLGSLPVRTLAQISDIHFGAEDPAAVKALRDDLLAEPYDLLIVSGDFTQRARVGQFKAAMDFLADMPGPHLYVPGNHDVPLHDVFTRFLAPMSKYKRGVSRDLRPTYADDELLVVGLNTARSFSWTWSGFWKDGRISCDQLLDVHLAASDAADDAFKVVVTHHPFLPPPDAGSHGTVTFEGETDEAPADNVQANGQIIRGSKRALRTLEAAGVELLLAGHLHMNYSGDVRNHHEAVRRSILSVQAGTACSHRRRGEPNAYNRITIESRAHDGLEHDRLTVQVRTLEGPAFGDGSSVTYEKYDDGWR